MSQRSKRRRAPPPTEEERPTAEEERPTAKRRGRPRRGEATRGWGLGIQVALLAVVFGVVVLVAELAGAANLGVALGIGQIAFALAVVYLLLRH